MSLAALLLPSALAAAAATAKDIDASKVQRLELPDTLVGPGERRVRRPRRRVVRQRRRRPHRSVGGNGNGSGFGWTTYTYSPSYTNNNCAAPSKLPPVATESSCGRPLGQRVRLMPAWEAREETCCPLTSGAYLSIIHISINVHLSAPA
jgi:hypothetical protein